MRTGWVRKGKGLEARVARPGGALATLERGLGFRWAVALAAMSAGLAAQRPSTPPSEPSAATATLHGEVCDGNGAPVPDAEVSFHSAATLGMPWLRSAADQVAVVRGRSDRAGRFAVSVPRAVSGTCLARHGDRVAVATRCDPGAPLRLRLMPLPQRRLTFAGAIPERVEIGFEGPSPLAGEVLSGTAGVFVVPCLPGFGGTLLLPPGLATRAGQSLVPGSGADRDRFVLVAAPVLEQRRRWARVQAEPSLSWPAGERWPQAAAAFGQDDAGRPFAVGDGRLELAGLRAGASGRVPGHGASRALLVAECRDLGPTPFVAALELPQDRAAFVLPAWLRDDVAHFVVLETVAGPSLLDARNELAPVFELRVESDTSALVRLRPARCRPAAGCAFAGLEVAVPGRATALPVRLPADRYEWVAMASDGRRAQGELAFDGRAGLRVAFDAGEELRGLVIDADGEPAAGVRVTLLSGRGDQAFSFGWSEHEVFTGVDGEFALRGLVAARDYELLASGAAWGEVFANGVRSEASPVLLQLRVPAAPR